MMPPTFHLEMHVKNIVEEITVCIRGKGTKGILKS
jgi:hypothetical protein